MEVRTSTDTGDSPAMDRNLALDRRQSLFGILPSGRPIPAQLSIKRHQPDSPTGLYLGAEEHAYGAGKANIGIGHVCATRRAAVSPA